MHANINTTTIISSTTIIIFTATTAYFAITCKAKNINIIFKEYINIQVIKITGNVKIIIVIS